MDPKTMHLIIVSPEHTLFDGLVNWVELPGDMGRFQVLYNHAPLISSLQKGNMVFETAVASSNAKPKTQTIAVTGGFVEVKNNAISVCVEQEHAG